jgi:hypothetical protein
MSIENEIAILTEKNQKLLKALYGLFGSEDPKELMATEAILSAHQLAGSDPAIQSSVFALKTVREVNAS